MCTAARRPFIIRHLPIDGISRAENHVMLKTQRADTELSILQAVRRPYRSAFDRGVSLSLRLPDLMHRCVRTTTCREISPNPWYKLRHK